MSYIVITVWESLIRTIYLYQTPAVFLMKTLLQSWVCTIMARLIAHATCDDALWTRCKWSLPVAYLWCWDLKWQLNLTRTRKQYWLQWIMFFNDFNNLGTIFMWARPTCWWASYAPRRIVQHRSIGKEHMASPATSPETQYMLFEAHYVCHPQW